MSNKSDIVIYPRGFAGFDIGLPTRIVKPTAGQVFNSLLHNTNIGRSNKVVISNIDVEKLWKELTTASRFGSNFAFREEILIAALNAFGTDNFFTWVNLQTNNPYLGSNHIRFINDTLAFIQGKNRALNVQHWLILLTDREGSPTDKTKVNTEEYFGTTKPLHMRESTHLKHAIIKWVSRPGGFEDLLGTMHVLFGDADIL